MFRSPNAGQTALTLQHATSPRSGYKPPAGHNADGYTMAERVKMAKGGSVKMAGGGMMAKGYKIGGKVATKGGTKGGVSGGTKVTRADGIAKRGKTRGKKV